MAGANYWSVPQGMYIHHFIMFFSRRGGGVFGSSIASLRGFSILCGVCSIPLMYVTARDAFRLGNSPRSRLVFERSGALVSAVLMTFHADQIGASRTARMYSLGVLLALASTWVMLWALRAERRQLWYWVAYGVAAALFCLTHYFAVFAAIGQGAFVVLEIARGRWTRRRPWVLSASAGYVTAVCVCLALLGPWLPVVATQVRLVRHDYWIPPLSLQAIDEALFWWTTGIPAAPTPLEACFVWVLLAAILTFSLWGLRASGLLFALQAAVPWVLCVALSAGGGRSVLQERYLIFSQLGLFGTLAVVAGRREGLPFRAGISSMLCFLTFCGTFQQVLRFPVQPSQARCAIQFVAQRAQDGDVVIASSYRTVNQLRYYASEARLARVRICCFGSPGATKGHVMHVASLQHSDMVSPSDSLDLQRAWFVFDCDEEIPFVPSGMRKVEERRFAGRTDGRWVAALYVGGGSP